MGSHARKAFPTTLVFLRVVSPSPTLQLLSVLAHVHVPRKRAPTNASGDCVQTLADAFVVRVFLAIVLLPIDFLCGNCVRSEKWGRPLLGAVGVAATYLIWTGIHTMGPDGGRAWQILLATLRI